MNVSQIPMFGDRGSNIASPNYTSKHNQRQNATLRNKDELFDQVEKLFDKIHQLCRSDAFGILENDPHTKSNTIHINSSSILRDPSIIMVFIWPYMCENLRANFIANLIDENFEIFISNSKNKKVFKFLVNNGIINENPNGNYFVSDITRKLFSSYFFKNHSHRQTFEDTKEKNIKSISQLVAYSRERWDLILSFIISQNPIDHAKKIGKDLAEVLFESNLVKNDKTINEGVGVSSSGFKFLLMPLGQQIAIFLLNYCIAIQKRDKNKLNAESALLLISKLSLLKPFEIFSSKSLNNEQIKVLQNFREMGLIFQRKRSDTSFYTTDLFSLITDFIPNAGSFVDSYGSQNRNLSLSVPRDPFDIEAQKSSFHDKTNIVSNQSTIKYDDLQYIIVESNLHVYAYSSSVLKLSLISLFCDIQYQFENMIVGLLTKESIQNAVRIGITAQEVIDFLMIHLHPVCSVYGQGLPGNIIDQIKLWEQTGHYFTFRPSIMYSNFSSEAEFTEILKLCQDEPQFLLYYSTTRQLLIVDESFHDKIVNFLSLN